MRLPRFHPAARASFTALLAVLVLTACGEKTSTAGGGGGGGGGAGRGGRGGGGGPAPVLVAQAARKVVPIMIDAIGSVEPIRSAAIRSQITGTLQKIAIQEGQDVKENDLLFEIDPRPLENALRSAEADFQKVTVQLENAHAQVKRYQQLSTEQMVSKEQFQKIQDDARVLEAQLESSRSAVNNARVQLNYSSIRAPLSGRTGNLNVHEGDLVRANDIGALVTINQLSPIYVTFGVPQQYLAPITRYRAERTLKVEVVPPGTDDKAEVGELTFIDNTVDPTTGTIKLKGSFPNETHRLWPGQFATTSVTLATPEVLAIPSRAVQSSQTGQHVFVVTADKKAELRPVVVERTFENDAVITKGLTEGETVVIDGQLRVEPGKPVEIKQPGGAAATGGDHAAGDRGGRKGGKGGKGGRGGKDKPEPAKES
jgi:membrane fusion protein, multidrug efflux system